MSNLATLFGIRTVQYLRNPPGPAIGGRVFVMEHFDGLEKYSFWSVNHQSASGDTGWESQRIYCREQAEAAADVLAEFCQAEVIG